LADTLQNKSKEVAPIVSFNYTYHANV